MIRIFVNGEARTITSAVTLVDLLATLELNGKRIAVEVNQEIISRSSFANTFLHDDDRVEIVHAIGGG